MRIPRKIGLNLLAVAFLTAWAGSIKQLGILAETLKFYVTYYRTVNGSSELNY